MRKYLIFENFRSMASPPPEEEGKSFASLTNLQYINNLSLAKLEYLNNGKISIYLCVSNGRNKIYKT